MKMTGFCGGKNLSRYYGQIRLHIIIINSKSPFNKNTENYQEQREDTEQFKTEKNEK